MMANRACKTPKARSTSFLTASWLWQSSFYNLYECLYFKLVSQKVFDCTFSLAVTAPEIVFTNVAYFG